MKNITVSISDDVYRAARVRAAERDTSVSALVKEYLTTIAGEAEDFARREALQEEVLGRITAFRAGDRMPREELYDRALR